MADYPTVRSGVDPVAHLLAYIEADPEGNFGDGKRLMRTAVTQLASVRNPSEPDEVFWLLTSRRQLAERLTVNGQVGSSSASSYASRVRLAAELYLGVTSPERVTGAAAEVLTDATARLRRSFERDQGRDRILHEREMVNRARHAASRPDGLDAEVTDILNNLGRWPNLKRFLLRATADALESAEKAYES